MIADKQEGRGTLTSKFFPNSVFDVEYSITFLPVIQTLPSAPHVQAMVKNVVHYIRDLNEKDIPNGEYYLEREADGAVETTRLSKTRQGWNVLCPDRP